MTLPIALTIGEPAGIGPEIAAAAWKELRETLPFFVIGDPAHIPRGVPVTEIGSPGSVRAAVASALPVLPLPFSGPRKPGEPNPRHARDVVRAIETGVKLVRENKAAALCTCPIHKKALMDGAGFAFPGHTEFLAHLARVERVVMMLASPALKVVPATIHVPLSEVPEALTEDLLDATLEIVVNAMQHDFGLPQPRVAVAGLNPHAGEGGKIGTEDEQVIAPVVQRWQSRGVDIRGPLSADTMFHERARKGYDVAIAMYHDQALIPIKTVDFDRGVNVTLGLPFVRTSPDHGTALDIAGQGIADPTSLIEALRVADQMARARAEQNERY